MNDINKIRKTLKSYVYPEIERYIESKLKRITLNETKYFNLFSESLYDLNDTILVAEEYLDDVDKQFTIEAASSEGYLRGLKDAFRIIQKRLSKEDIEELNLRLNISLFNIQEDN